jgi:MFS family permease
VAEKHGQRLVLFISLFGSAITCLSFGTSISLRQAIAIRLLQGIFAGAVGVARGCVAFVTDASNEGRAYAILGYANHLLAPLSVGFIAVEQILLGSWRCGRCHHRWYMYVKHPIALVFTLDITIS